MDAGYAHDKEYMSLDTLTVCGVPDAELLGLASGVDKLAYDATHHARVWWFRLAEK